MSLLSLFTTHVGGIPVQSSGVDLGEGSFGLEALYLCGFSVSFQSLKNPCTPAPIFIPLPLSLLGKER